MPWQIVGISARICVVFTVLAFSFLFLSNTEEKIFELTVSTRVKRFKLSDPNEFIGMEETAQKLKTIAMEKQTKSEPVMDTYAIRTVYLRFVCASRLFIEEYTEDLGAHDIGMFSTFKDLVEITHP